MANKKRATKTSKGIHGGGGKTNLDLLTLTLFGKGPLVRSAVLADRRAAMSPGGRRDGKPAGRRS